MFGLVKCRISKESVKGQAEADIRNSYTSSDKYQKFQLRPLRWGLGSA